MRPNVRGTPARVFAVPLLERFAIPQHSCIHGLLAQNSRDADPFSIYCASRAKNALTQAIIGSAIHAMNATLACQ